MPLKLEIVISLIIHDSLVIPSGIITSYTKNDDQFTFVTPKSTPQKSTNRRIHQSCSCSVCILCMFSRQTNGEAKRVCQAISECSQVVVAFSQDGCGLLTVRKNTYTFNVFKNGLCKNICVLHTFEADVIITPKG